MRIEECVRALREGGFENANIEALRLFECFGEDIPPYVVKKRLQHYPLQYLLGTWSFWREEYEVSEHCLVPRADTELLVEIAVRELGTGAVFLDLCTGSGCVAVSSCAERGDVSALGVDLFPETLALAARNAARNGVADRVSFLQADVLKTPPNALQNAPLFDAILSNPPYVTAAEMECLQPEVRYEPRAALYGGEDGLDFYRAILQGWTCLLKDNGFVLFEIGAAQATALCALAEQYGFCAEVFRDLCAKDRAVLLKRMPK